MIVAGLTLRLLGYDVGLPFVVVKYGGSILWGAMVYLLMAAFAGGRSVALVVGVSLAFAVAVELSRLHHTPSLDAFRLTTAGALLLGRVFSPWNLVAYGAGIGMAALLTRFWRRRGGTEGR